MTSIAVPANEWQGAYNMDVKVGRLGCTVDDREPKPMEWIPCERFLLTHYNLTASEDLWKRNVVGTKEAFFAMNSIYSSAFSVSCGLVSFLLVAVALVTSLQAGLLVFILARRQDFSQAQRIARFIIALTVGSAFCACISLLLLLVAFWPTTIGHWCDLPRPPPHFPHTLSFFLFSTKEFHVGLLYISRCMFQSMHCCVSTCSSFNSTSSTTRAQ